MDGEDPQKLAELITDALEDDAPGIAEYYSWQRAATQAIEVVGNATWVDLAQCHRA